MACCNKCKRQAAKVAGMKRGKSQSQIITTGLSVAGGVAIAKVVTGMDFIQANPILKIAVPVAGAILTPTIAGKSAMAAGLSAGMFAEGAMQAISQFIPGIASTVGLAGTPYKSAYFPGVGAVNEVPKVIY